MIRGQCNAKGDWPKTFAAVPNIGDCIEGTIDDKTCVMTVCKITHSTTTSHDVAMNRTYQVPLIIIDLE